jgi:hypothetical protein
MKFMIEVQYTDKDKDNDYLVEDIKAGLEFYELESKENADIYTNESLLLGYDWVQVIDINKFIGA